MDKLSLCVLMTQCGKTFVAIDHINRRLMADPSSVHVVYTMNTLLNNAQFAKRLETIEATYGPGSVLIFSSVYKGAYHHVKSLDEVASRSFRVLLMCSHHQRFADGFEYVTAMNESNPGTAIHMYYDELHYYLNKKLRNMIEAVHELDNVKSILALTATPNGIIQKRGKWSQLTCVTPSMSFDGYARSSDMNMVAVDDIFPAEYVAPAFNDFDTMDEETIGFLRTVMDRTPAMFEPKARSFVPAHIRRVGHTKVRDMILEKCPEAVVVVINAMEKSITWSAFEKSPCGRSSGERSPPSAQNVSQQEPHHEQESPREIQDENGPKVLRAFLKSADQEVSERIGAILTQEGLLDRPLFVTGYLCVGMGQTLTHKSFGNFTHAVLGHMSANPDAIYQLFGRLTGRVKSWETYVPTTVYAPTRIMNRIKVMEQCAFAMYKKLTVTRDEYQGGGSSPHDEL